MGFGHWLKHSFHSVSHTLSHAAQTVSHALGKVPGVHLIQHAVLSVTKPLVNVVKKDVVKPIAGIVAPKPKQSPTSPKTVPVESIQPPLGPQEHLMQVSSADAPTVSNDGAQNNPQTFAEFMNRLTVAFARTDVKIAMVTGVAAGYVSGSTPQRRVLEATLGAFVPLAAFALLDG